jgi:hypothetical protein
MTTGSWLVTAALTLVGVGVVMVLLAVGVLLGRRPLRGSCGAGGGACACGARTGECDGTGRGA